MPRSRIIFIGILGVAVLIVVIIGVLRPQMERANADATATAAIFSPTRTAQAAAANQVTIVVNYGTEKEGWLKAATERFAQANPDINVVLDGQGSMSSYQDLVQLTESSTTLGRSRRVPQLWSPASEIQVNLLNSAVPDRAQACKRLVLSPMAIMMWEDRAAAFEAAFKNEGGITFQNLEKSLADPKYGGRWANIGGNPNWGLVKIGYTSPQESNSGIMLLMALANNYYNRAARITSAEATDPTFAQWMSNIANAVSQPLRSSSGLLMEDFIAKGPGSYDMVIVYEALAIEYFKAAIGRHNLALRIVYPPYNLYSDHPMCLVNHPSLTQAQREAAQRYVDFLLTEDIQKLALTFGYRPADLKIPLFGANTPFDDPQMRKAGIGTDVGQELVVPEGPAINNLLTGWRRAFTG